MGDGGGGHCLVRMEWRPAGWSLCLPLLIFPCTIKFRSSLLVPAHPDGPGWRAVKRLWTCGGGGDPDHGCLGVPCHPKANTWYGLPVYKMWRLCLMETQSTEPNQRRSLTVSFLHPPLDSWGGDVAAFTVALLSNASYNTLSRLCNIQSNSDCT